MTTREEQRRRELAEIVRRDWAELEGAFDHRRDGLAASRRFDARMRIHVCLSGERRFVLLSRLIRAERALGRQ